MNMNVLETVKHTCQCCELVRTWFQKTLKTCSLLAASLEGGGRSGTKYSGIHSEFLEIAASYCLAFVRGWRASASASASASARASDARVAANRLLGCRFSIAAGVVL